MARSRFICLPAVVAVVVLGSGVAPAGQDNTPQSSFSESADVLAVELPVTVTVGNQPVRGLKAENFEVLSGKERQPIVGFEVVDLDVVDAVTPSAPRSASSPPPSAVAVARRHVLMLFDLSYTQPSALERAKAAARLALKSSLHPSDLVGIATYDPTDGAHLLLGFTPDRELAAHALEGIGGPKLVERSGDPLRLTLAMMDEVMTHTPAVATTREGPGADAIADKKQAIQEEMNDRVNQSARASERSTRDAARDRVEAMTRSYADLARLFGTIPGRKSILLLSEGFDSGLLLGKEESRHDREAVEAGEVWKVDADKKYGSTTTQSMLGHMLEEFRRAGCVIEAIDVGGLRAVADAQLEQVGSQQVGGDVSLSNAGQDSLFVMANETGGDLFRNSNDLGGALHAALAKTSVYLRHHAGAERRASRRQLPPAHGAPQERTARGARGGAQRLLRAAPVRSAQLGRARPRSGGPDRRRRGGRPSRRGAPRGAARGRQGFDRARSAVARGRRRDPDAGQRHRRSARRRGLLLRSRQIGPRARPPGADSRARPREARPEPLGSRAQDLRRAGAAGRHLHRARPGPQRHDRRLRATLRGRHRERERGRNAAPRPVVPEPLNKWLNVPASRTGTTAAAYPFVVGSRPVMPAAQPVLVTGGEVPLCVFTYGFGEGGTLRVRLRGRSGDEHEIPAELVDRAAAGAGLERLLLRPAAGGLRRRRLHALGRARHRLGHRALGVGAGRGDAQGRSGGRSLRAGVARPDESVCSTTSAVS
jgi:VWFA-related protein